MVLYKFENEKSQYLEEALNQFSAYRNYYDVKAGLLIFMEDLMVYALMNQKENVDTRGILGSSKADDELSRNIGSFDLITLHAEKTKGVLVRQIQLGVSGRYKGPFMNMGLITKNFSYIQTEFSKVDRLLMQWPEAVKLVDKLIEILVKLVQESNHDYPRATLDQYKNDAELWSLYAECFKYEKVNTALKNYWEEKLGMKDGAAQSVYKQINKDTVQETSLIFGKALKEEANEEEKVKIQKILDVEPLLSICTQVFYLLANTSVKHIEDVQNELEKLSELLPLSNVKYLTHENARLKMLYNHLDELKGGPQELATAVLDYHKKIMENRGGGAWVELDNGQLKHYIHQSTTRTTEEILSGGYWYHDYYFSAVSSIYNGLNPN